jgi:hypothetical protein
MMTDLIFEYAFTDSGSNEVYDVVLPPPEFKPPYQVRIPPDPRIAKLKAALAEKDEWVQEIDALAVKQKERIDVLLKLLQDIDHHGLLWVVKERDVRIEVLEGQRKAVLEQILLMPQSGSGYDYWVGQLRKAAGSE